MVIVVALFSEDAKFSGLNIIVNMYFIWPLSFSLPLVICSFFYFYR